VQLVREVLSWQQPAMETPQLQFEWSHDAATANWNVLKQNNLDVRKTLQSQGYSPLSFGSEFKPPSIIAPLLQHHPLWPRFKSSLEKGAELPLESMSEEDRIQDLREAMDRGNHKSANDNEEDLINMLI